MSKTIYNKNPNLGSRETKNKILQYLYKNVIDLNVKQEPICKGDMEYIRDNDYVICPRFSGTRSWIIFFNVGNDYFAVNFPKHSQRKKEDLRIHPINVRINKEFYRGTIMEGIYYQRDEKKFLVIDEVYLLAGEDQRLKSKDDRLTNLARYIKTSIETCQDFCICVSQFYQINKRSLRDLYEKIKADTFIQEIIFYPKLYGSKIFSYTILDSDLVDRIIKISQFQLQKTSSPDVYNLIALDTGKKIDIAYIPDMETSKKCKQWFKDSKKKILLVKCQMDTDKKKWIPKEIVEDDIKNNDSESDSSDNSDSEETEIIEV